MALWFQTVKKLAEKYQIWTLDPELEDTFGSERIEMQVTRGHLIKSTGHLLKSAFESVRPQELNQPLPFMERRFSSSSTPGGICRKFLIMLSPRSRLTGARLTPRVACTSLN